MLALDVAVLRRSQAEGQAISIRSNG